MIQVLIPCTFWRLPVIWKFNVFVHIFYKILIYLPFDQQPRQKGIMCEVLVFKYLNQLQIVNMN